jgi:hypothetical protein
VGMRFCGHVPNSPRNKNSKRHIPYPLQKCGFLGPQQTDVPLGRGKNTYSSTLNVMISQMVGKHKLIGATANMLRGPFWSPFWSFNGIFYSIISSISSKIVQKVFNVVNNGMFYSKYYQFQ